MPDEHEQARLQIVMQEKLHYMSELLDYNKRLDRTVVLYISAVYAAIGLRATDKLDFSKLQNDQCVSLALLFIFLNACILLHGFAQSCWTMSIAKFIHLKLDGELLPMAGYAVSRNRCKKTDIDNVDVLGWDDWRNEIKGVANDTREKVFVLWVLLVLASSICSLTLVKVPDFLETHRVVGYLAIVILILIHGYIFFKGAIYLFFCRHYHDHHVRLPAKKYLIIRCLTATALFVIASWLAATYHF